ncbi:MAG: hypothetical protein ACRYGP_15610 [Janthinobacterium lividum]
MSDGVTHLSIGGLRPRSLAEGRASTFGVVQDQVLATLLGLALTGLPVALNFLGQPVAVGVCLGLAALTAWRYEAAVPSILLVGYLFQTTFVAYASAYVSDVSSLDAMKSYNFVTTAGIWFVLALRFVETYGAASPFVRRLTLYSCAALAVTGCYYVPGLLYDARGATIYLRNIALPLMLFQICLSVGSRHRFSMSTAVMILLGTLVACGYFELLFVERWLDLTHGWSYLDLGFADRRANPITVREARETGAVVGTTLDILKTNFLNTGVFGDLGTITRIEGPNFHPISFGYALAALVGVAAVQGRWLLVVAALPLMVIVGAKGALVLVLASLAFVAAARLRPTSSTLWIFLAMLGLYATIVFRSGLANGDYHVLGLLGGLSGFASDPIGHTLGQGGNLSVAFATLDFEKFQQAGVAAMAVESAVGVLLYQMGICGFAVLGFYIWIATLCWRLYRDFRIPVLALAAAFILVTLVNGLFQEEALFAPLALGLVMLIVGLTLGAVDRSIASRIAAAPGTVTR